MDQEVHATAGREASATGTRLIGGIQEPEGSCSLRFRIAGNLFSSSRGSKEREGQKSSEQQLRAVVHSRIMAKEREVASAERLAAEGGIASGESAVTEPEIEDNEGSVEEPEKEPDVNTEWEGEYGEAGCPIWMGEYHGDVRCGRKFHAAPEGVDEKPVCLMHSKDPRKQSGPLFDAFLLEFERILEDAGEYLARFQHFVFPQLDLAGRYIEAICLFIEATFTQNADFRKATFTQNSDFTGTIFTQDANFSNVTFTLNTDFAGAIFMQDADFIYAIFTQDASFAGTTFKQPGRFHGATFAENAEFTYTNFEMGAWFLGTTFTQNADFGFATFTQRANFSNSTFTRHTDFLGVTFRQSTDFSDATFMQAACFTDAKFLGTADWGGSRFLDGAEFRCTKFEPLVEEEPSALFALAKFSKPGEIVFDDVDLSRALFYHCDVSQVWFTSSVRWGARGNNPRLAVFDEMIPLEHKFAEGLQRDGQRDYRAVAQIYQQLKKNYDSRLDYWTANEFHFGEMEMMRLAGPADGPLLWLRRWWHPRLSFVALYRWASDYGNSYRKPMVWLLGVLVLFTALLPLPRVGLMRQGAWQAETYDSVWNLQRGYGENLWAEARLFGKSTITSVDTATFQRSGEYAPAYPWGRVLAIIETLLTSSLFALFLLAIRRQFRR